MRLDSVHAATVRGAGADAAPIPQADAGAGFVARAADGGAAPSNGGYGNGAAAGPVLLLEGDAADEGEPEIGPVLPEGLGSGLGEEDEEDDPWRLPITHEVAFEGACCVGAEPSPIHFLRMASSANVRPSSIHLTSAVSGLHWHLTCQYATVPKVQYVCF